MPRGKERPQPALAAGYRPRQPIAPAAPDRERSGRHGLLYLGGAVLALLLLFGWSRGLGALAPSTCLFRPSAP